jgi:hypothetical protein
MALLPTPASPIRIGLFFLRRERICTTRSISRSRPITGSILPSRAMRVRSVPNRSSSCEVARVSADAASSASIVRMRISVRESSSETSLRSSSPTTSASIPYISRMREAAVARSATIARRAWAVDTVRVSSGLSRSSFSKAS